MLKGLISIIKLLRVKLTFTKSSQWVIKRDRVTDFGEEVTQVTQPKKIGLT